MTRQLRAPRLGAVRLTLAFGLALLAVPLSGITATAAVGDASIVIQVGGDRTGTAADAVAPLSGVTLQLYADNAGALGSALADPWATCISDAAGACTFTVPDAGGANNGKQFWVKQTGAPAGWVANPALRTGPGSGDSSTELAYQFRTPAVTAGTAISGADFMTGSSGIWQDSRSNPTLPPGCGLNVAMLLDLSHSVEPSLADLKTAANTFADSLVGTSSKMAVFSFSIGSPASGGQNRPNLMPVTTQAQADSFKAQYASWTTGGGTNWDQGLYAVAPPAAQHYDLVVVITDGNPTAWAGDLGTTNVNGLKDDEYGIYSADKLKSSTGARVVAVGVGSGVTSPTSGLNLAAISGPTKYDGSNSLTADYYQEATYAAAGQALRALALGSCRGSLTVIKHLVPAANTGTDVTGATLAGAGWTFGATSNTNGVGVTPDSATTDNASTVTFDTTIPGGTPAAGLTVTEAEHADHTMVRVDCWRLSDQSAVSSTLGGTAAAPSFALDVPAADGVTCDVYNRPAHPAAWQVVKTATVVGREYADPAHAEPGDTIHYTLTASRVGNGGDVTDVDLTDDLSDVVDDGQLQLGSIVASNGTATPSATSIAWHINTIHDPVTLSYDVVVNDSAYNATLRNVVTAPGSANCQPASQDPACRTTHRTPHWLVVKSSDEPASVTPGQVIHYHLTVTNNSSTDVLHAVVNDDLSAVLDDATLDLPLAAGLAPTAKGLQWTVPTPLAPGQSVSVAYSVTVHANAWNATLDNHASPGEPGGDCATVETPGDQCSTHHQTPPPPGKLQIIAKRQFELNANGDWVPSDGITEFGKRVKYVMAVRATGSKLFHNVRLTDYVPGYNPEDTTSTMKATLVPGSAKCLGFTCGVSVGSDHRVTWSAGTVTNASGTVEMVVRFPAAPAHPSYNANGVFTAKLWNVAYLFWLEEQTSARAVTLVPGSMRSNEVVIRATVIQPAPPGTFPCTRHCLPNTGAASYLLQLGALGGLALIAGTALVARGRRHRSG